MDPYVFGSFHTSERAEGLKFRIERELRLRGQTGTTTEVRQMLDARCWEVAVPAVQRPNRSRRISCAS
jgi:hypothetical protein